MGTFPWDLLKAETLRSLCRDLGFSNNRTRATMITILSTIEEQGLDEALKLHLISSPQKTQERSILRAPPGLSKQALGPVVSDYNTRHKNKRVRISDPGPSRRRGAVSRQAVSILKPRTPRRGSKQKPVSPSGQREIFDGVELPATYIVKGKRKAPIEDSAMEEQTFEIDTSPANADEVFEGDSRNSRDESSPADSNKENEMQTGAMERMSSPNYAHGDGDNTSTHRVLDNTTETVVSITDDDMDAEGEIILDSELPIDHHLLIHTHESPHLNRLTVEDVGEIEQMLRTVANGQS